jgi:c-di-GMP-binding flagellar brake protein YcgR
MYASSLTCFCYVRSVGRASIARHAVQYTACTFEWATGKVFQPRFFGREFSAQLARRRYNDSAVTFQLHWFSEAKMSSVPSTDRRHYKRLAMSTLVRLHHVPSDREYPARSVDVSDGGMLMYVPAIAPLALGHRIRICAGSSGNGEGPGRFEADLPLAAQPVNGTIVRVDRGKLASIGQILVGVKFDL